MLDSGVRFCPHDGTPLTETASATGVRTPASSRPRSRELQLPVVVGERYRLEEVRGGGGMAKVYKAIDLTLEREVAVKLINPELRAEPEFDARFQREARIASQLADPHIVVVHDFGIDATHGPFLVMEYLQGQSLRERLATGGPLPLKAGLQLSGQLFLALIHAHGKNIVHRDIKPDNIFLLNQSGVRLHVRILDFGIARIYRRDEPGKAETLTNPGAVLGTPRYMSPEQLAGQPVDARSDIYSAALVIHESLTGQLPYVSGKRLCELCPDATAALQDLLDQCLKPNPGERPPSAVEVYLRLQELGKASGILLLPPGAMDKLLTARQAQAPTVAYVPREKRTLPGRSRRWWLLAAAVLLALAVVLGLLKVLLPNKHQPPQPADHETLLGIQIADRQGDAEKALNLIRQGVMNPWASGAAPYLGHVLKPEYLGMAEADLNRLDVESTPDQRVGVLFFEGKVRAIVVQQPHPGRTSRDVGIGSSVADLFRTYDEDAVTHAWEGPGPGEDKTPGKHRGEIRVYEKLGVAFLIQKDKITEIALFPPKASE
jgi:tRNA A-37 threonylcarbamoyl transferase component Bud32